MAFERVTCEIYFRINCYENYSEYRRTMNYGDRVFESKEDAENFLLQEGFEPVAQYFKKHQAYLEAWVSRHLREIKE